MGSTSLGPEKRGGFWEVVGESGVQRGGTGLGGEFRVGAAREQERHDFRVTHGGCVVERSGSGFAVLGVDGRTGGEQQFEAGEAADRRDIDE